MANEDKQKKQDVSTAAKTHQYSALYDIAGGGDFEKEATGFAPYWKPAMFCTACAPMTKGEPGRKLGDREFTCIQENADGRKHDKEFLIGAIFVGRVMGRDVQKKENGDPFVRWLFLASRAPIPCFQGPTSENERILVGLNEPFNVSEYQTLPFENYYGCEIVVFCKSKRAIGDGHTLWNFELRIQKDMKKQLDAERLASAEGARVFMMKQAQQRRQLAEASRLESLGKPEAQTAEQPAESAAPAAE